MRRTLTVALIAILIPAFLGGCACSLDDAAEMATKARAKEAGGMREEALKDYLEAGMCVADEASDNPQARYLILAIHFRLHGMGGLAALPAGETADWARSDLRESGDPDFLHLAFRGVLSLEGRTFTAEQVPGWATVDRLLVVSDFVRMRADEVASMVPTDVFATVPPEFALAVLRLGSLEVARGFAVQGWRRALDAGAPPDIARERLAATYREMASALGTMGSVQGLGAEAREEIRLERERHIALSERVALILNPDDLHHPVEREMLKLDIDTHLREGRRMGLDAFAEKQSGNRARALVYLRGAGAHFALALTIGVGGEIEKRGALGMMGELIMKTWELMR